VHDLGAPATEAELARAEETLGRALPPSLRDLLGQWNGGWLFHDDHVLYGAPGARGELAQLALDGGRIRFARGPAEELLLDERGRVIARDLDTGDERVAGSDLERWLDATMAREAVVYDRDGEFRDEAFDGGELSESARRKRAKAAAKADPASPAWHQELAEILVDEGDEDGAIAEMEKAADVDPGDAELRTELARLRAHRALRPI
jgi:hypothetical protein